MDTPDYANFKYVETNYAYDAYVLHCHNYYEVYYFLNGDVDYIVEGQQYVPEPHNILLLPPGAFHGVKVNSSRPYQRYTLHFQPDVLSFERRSFLLSIFPPMQRYQGQKIIKNADQFHIVAYLEALMACNAMKEEQRAQIMPICVEALLARISCMPEKNAEILKNSREDVPTEIIWYLNQHLGEKLSLDDLSERFFISKHHLNKVFRRTTGTTVFDYLIRKRISYAQHLLVKGVSTQEAAMQAGFNDYSAFYRSYMRVVGHSPSQDKHSLYVANPCENEQTRYLEQKTRADH